MLMLVLMIWVLCGRMCVRVRRVVLIVCILSLRIRGLLMVLLRMGVGLRLLFRVMVFGLSRVVFVRRLGFWRLTLESSAPVSKPVPSVSSRAPTSPMGNATCIDSPGCCAFSFEVFVFVFVVLVCIVLICCEWCVVK